MLTSYLGKAQNCIPVAIVFTTQAQVDAFPTDYPGCTIIDGNVGITGNDITNIDALNQITKINGSLQILNTGGLYNLDGFENLTHVQGNVILNNAAVNNINGLDNLNFIGAGLNIESCHGLTVFDGLNSVTSVGGDFRIAANVQLTEFTGLSNLTNITGSLYISYNDQLNNISSFISLTSIGGNLAIEHYNSNSAFNIIGLNNVNIIGGYIFLSGNISGLSAFNNLTTINGFLKIFNNNSISTIDGFNAITLITEYLEISGNLVLTSISGFNNLANLGELNLVGNVFLTTIEGFDHPMTIGNLSVTGNSFLSNCAVEAICNKLWGNNNYATINNNGPNCASVPIVLQNCGTAPDGDGDGVNDFVDNCPTISNPLQTDCNYSQIGDVCESGDIDTDGVVNANDNCPCIQNPNQADANNNGIGNICDYNSDSDGDGRSDASDNCPSITNTDQSDCNGNGLGNVCDLTSDSDGDLILDYIDNCPCQGNPNQADANNNGIGDISDNNSDSDGDGRNDSVDNCPSISNTDQSDWNYDGIGDVCQDSDVDGIMDNVDNCRDIANNDQADCDSDGIGDACTNFILDTMVYTCFYFTWDTGNDSTYYESGIYTFDTTYANGCTYSKTLQLTITNSGSQYSSEVTSCNQYAWEINDSIYTKSGTYVHYINECYKATLYLTIDSVGTNTHQYEEHCASFTWINGTTYTSSGDYYIINTVDNNCPDTLTLHLSINGGPDDDNDGWSNDCDNCPTVSNADQLDCNNNSIGDACEPADTDCDGIFDSVDNCPNHPNPFQTDLNNNGLGDACEDFPKMGFNTSNPLTEFHLSNGTLYIDNPEKGIILKNYQGQCFILKMDGLSLTATLIPCP